MIWPFRRRAYAPLPAPLAAAARDPLAEIRATLAEIERHDADETEAQRFDRLQRFQRQMEAVRDGTVSRDHRGRFKMVPKQ